MTNLPRDAHSVVVSVTFRYFLQFVGTCRRSLQAQRILVSTSHLSIVVPVVPLQALLWLCSVLVFCIFQSFLLPDAPIKVAARGS